MGTLRPKPEIILPIPEYSTLKILLLVEKFSNQPAAESQTDFTAVRIRQNKSIGDQDIQYPNGVIIKLHSPVDLVMVKTLLQIF